MISQPQFSKNFLFLEILSYAGCKKLMERKVNEISFFFSCLTWIFSHFFHFFCMITVKALVLHLSLKSSHIQSIVICHFFLPHIEVVLSSAKLAPKMYACLFHVLYAEGFRDVSGLSDFC